MLDEIYTLQIIMWMIHDMMLIFVCLLVDLMQGFCYSNLKQKTDGLELTLTITLELQANPLNQVC